MFEIFRDKAGQFRYRIKGQNGEIMATSEAYTRKRDAKRGLDDLRRLMANHSFPVADDPDLIDWRAPLVSVIQSGKAWRQK